MRTSSIVHFIFFFWSFEISGNILINQKLLNILTHCLIQVFAIRTPFGLTSKSVFGLTALLKLEFTVCFLRRHYQ